MPLDPFLTTLVPTMGGLPDPIVDFDTWREQDSKANDALTTELTEPGPVVAEIHNVLIPVQGGTIELRIYYPAGDGPHPAHLYLHGGGWFAASVHDLLVDIACRERAVYADCVVVAVNYRKAPEHKFPTGLNDCYAALCWVAEHADDLGVQPDLITVSGQSAGANLAAALCLKTRDEAGPAIAFQLLEVPALDLTLSAASFDRNGTGYGLTADGVAQCLRYYLTNSEEALLPYASPLRAPDLSGLPPAHIMSAEYDPLCDDGQAYATRLTQAGVPTTYTLQPGHIHTSNAFTKVMAASRAWRQELTTTLGRAHAREISATRA
jgi:acetyl esterase